MRVGDAYSVRGVLTLFPDGHPRGILGNYQQFTVEVQNLKVHLGGWDLNE